MTTCEHAYRFGGDVEELLALYPCSDDKGPVTLPNGEQRLWCQTCLDSYNSCTSSANEVPGQKTPFLEHLISEEIH